MRFDSWTDAINGRVAAAVPQVCVKRKREDVCRWIYAGRECQIHAVSDTLAAFVVIVHKGATLMNCPFKCYVMIASGSEDEVATRIIGWLATKVA